MSVTEGCKCCGGEDVHTVDCLIPENGRLRAQLRAAESERDELARLFVERTRGAHWCNCATGMTYPAAAKPPGCILARDSEERVKELEDAITERLRWPDGILPTTGCDLAVEISLVIDAWAARVKGLEAELTAERDAVRAERDERDVLIRWMLGEADEFPPREPYAGAFWWRKELRRRFAALRPRAR